MSKPRRRIATGLSVADVMKMPVSKIAELSLSEQREIVSRLGSAANKRLRNLESQNIYNSAREKLLQSGGKISVKGKSGDDLIREFNRARNFLQNKFSSVKSWKQTVKKLAQSPTLENIKETDVSKVFGMYDMLREIESYIVDKVNKYDLMNQIENYLVTYPEESDEDMIKRTFEWIQNQTEKENERYESTNRRFSSGLEYDTQETIPERLQTNKLKRRKSRK